MATSGFKGVVISGNENGNEMRDNPIPSNQIPFGQGLNVGIIINQYGQLMGEYSRLDDELWLSNPEDDETSYENTVNLEKMSEHVDNFVCDGGMASVKENSSSSKDLSQNQSQSSSPVSVLQRKRAFSDIRATSSSQSKQCQIEKHNSSGGVQIFGTTFSVGEQSSMFHSEPEYSMESSLLDETEDFVPIKQLRTRKISDLLDLDSERAVKKCMHCATTDTPQWRTGPMGRKTLCNACGVQYKHGRLYSDYRPIRSPTFNPSLHTNLPKKVQEIRMGNTSERGPTPTAKSMRLEEMKMGNSGEMGQNLMCEPKKEMSLGHNNERDQTHARRAKKFKEMREKVSRLLQSDAREKNQNLDSKRIPKGKLSTKAVKKCLHCESTKTPQWREGPMGRHTLCNACGVQYRFGRLYPEYRPLKSPTYDPSLHSHLPKKVLKMRISNAEKCATSCNNEQPA